MKTTVEELENNKVSLKVEVPKADWEKAVARTYKSLASKLNVPGFRQGKIPPKVIDLKISKEGVLQETFREALPHYYLKALEVADIKPIDQPEIEIIQIKENKPLLFKLKVKVLPKVDLGNYRGIEVEKALLKVTGEEINFQLSLLQQKLGKLRPVSGRSLKSHDFALINFEGKLEGKSLEGGSAKDFLLEIGSGTFLSSFEEQLIGGRAGEIREIWVDFPLDHPQVELAGKKVKFRVLIKEIKEKVLPPLDDEFAKNSSEFESLKELKEDIKEKLKKIKKLENEAKLKLDILEKLSKETKVEIPEALIQRRVEEMKENFRTQVERRGLSFENYLKTRKLEPKTLEKEFREEAERTLKNRLILEEVVRREGLEVKEEELDNELRKVASQEKKDFTEFKEKALEKGYFKLLKEDVKLRKALDFLVKHAKIIDKEEVR